MTGKLTGKRIVLGVTGSIAAYKAVLLLRLLVEKGAEVQVVMTEGAKQFVAPLTFATLSRKPVLENLWDDESTWTQHVQLAHNADLIVVAPCTAQTLFKLAHGACDNLLSAVCLSAACPIFLAPAMDREMYAHPQTQANLQRVVGFGTKIIEPTAGFLASGLEGKGRLAEPETILAAIEDFFEKSSPSPPLSGGETIAPSAQLSNVSPPDKGGPGGDQPLAGKKILITAGPTQEPIDAVRYISNHLTGKMGVALAETAATLGAEVTLVLGPTSLVVSPNVHVVRVQTAQQMFEAVNERYAEQDGLIMSAAVADYRPKDYSEKKIKKKQDNWSLELEKTPDILYFVGQNKRPNQILVGFALETDNELANAMEKLKKKNLDLIVLNSLRDPQAGFGYDTNQATLITRNEQQTFIPLTSKTALANDILQQMANLFQTNA